MLQCVYLDRPIMIDSRQFNKLTEQEFSFSLADGFLVITSKATSNIVLTPINNINFAAASRNVSAPISPEPPKEQPKESPKKRK